MSNKDAKPVRQSAPSRVNALPFSTWIPLLAGALAGVAIRIVFSGEPGRAYAAMTSGFIYFAPAIVGAVTVYVAERKERRTWNYYAAASFVANLLFVLGTMIILIEGILCAIIIAPLFGMLGAIGGLIMGAICRWTNWPKKALYGIGIVPLLLGSLDPEIPTNDAVGVIQRSTIIDADAEHVWRHIVNVSQIEPGDINQAWLFRIGVPLPKSGIFQERGGERIRRVTMGRNVYFDEVIRDFERARYLRWGYRYYPDSFPPHSLDEHVVLGGHYFDITDTSYRLDPLGDRTQVTVTMRYRITTRFNWYAVPVGEWLLGNLADVNLAYYRRQSESARARRD